jgi:acetolactate synthase-1/2/3 large subunit
MNVAEFIVSGVKAENVNTVFVLNGGGIMYLMDALNTAKGINVVNHHHEQCAGMAADAYGRVTNNLGVCFATSGPGGTNLITAIVGAYQDSSPCLFVVGQSKSTETISRSGFEPRQIGTFEVDLVPLVQSICKFTKSVCSPEEAPEILKEAIFQAKSGRPGPSVVEIPIDIQGAEISWTSDEEKTPKQDQSSNLKVNTYNKFQRSLISDLRKSKKPCLLVGKGVTIANCKEKLIELATKWKIPVVTTQFGKDSIDNYSEYFFGHCGPKGTRSGNFAIQNADFVLSIGCSLHGQTVGWEQELFAPNAKFYRTDIDLQCLNIKKPFVDQSALIPVDQILNDLIELNLPIDASKWLSNCRDFDSKNRTKDEHYQKNAKTINIYDVMIMLNEAFVSDEVFVSDAGSAFYASGQALTVNATQSFVTSASLGAMGYAVPAATGAAAASPNRKVVCITGDGSLMTNLSELSVAKYHGYDITYVILNNGGYVSMRNTQDAFFCSRRIGADLGSGVLIPSIKQIAKLFGIRYIKIKKQNEFSVNSFEVAKLKGPVIIEILCNVNQEIIPTIKSRRLENGKMLSAALHPMFPFKDG